MAQKAYFALVPTVLRGNAYRNTTGRQSAFPRRSVGTRRKPYALPYLRYRSSQPTSPTAYCPVVRPVFNTSNAPYYPRSTCPQYFVHQVWYIPIEPACQAELGGVDMWSAAATTPLLLRLRRGLYTIPGKAASLPPHSTSASSETAVSYVSSNRGGVCNGGGVRGMIVVELGGGWGIPSLVPSVITDLSGWRGCPA